MNMLDQPFPLRADDTGRFLGVFTEEGRWIGHYTGGFDGANTVAAVPEGAGFRNETLGVTFRWTGERWQPIRVEDPNACRLCDFSKRRHQFALHHAYTEPTDEQRLYRMRARREQAPEKSVRALP